MDYSYDLLLTGGIVVTGAGMRRADVGVRGETIAAVEPSIPRTTAHQVIDVTGKYILPGVIDAHVHPVYEDDIEHCSRVAAYGGTTTLLHFISARTGESLLQQVEAALKDGEARSLLDFGIHGGMFDAPRQVAEIPQVMELGIRTFKFFLTYVKLGWSTDDYQLTRAMDMLAQLGGMAIVHSENGGAIDYLEDKYFTPEYAGKHGWKEAFRISRPAVLEEEAIFRVICLAEVTGCPVYIPHVTTARSLRPLRLALAEGKPVFAETCIHYLTLTEDILDEYGAQAKVGPALRSASDRAALWDALRDGTLHTVASDHAPKVKSKHGDFLKQPYGTPQSEILLPLTYDEGVNHGHISLVRLVQVLCENPARIFGLYPRKGTIAVGSDADMVVFDPAREWTIRAENLHSRAGYTLYEGRTVLGWPEMSFQRGHRILWQGEVLAAPGQGHFLPVRPGGLS
jgi:dihydropyrimidinase